MRFYSTFALAADDDVHMEPGVVNERFVDVADAVKRPGLLVLTRDQASHSGLRLVRCAMHYVRGNQIALAAKDTP